MRSRTPLLGALAATLALLAACSSSNDPGPLVGGGFGNTPGGECIPEPIGHPVADGVFFLDNTGTTPVTITSVKLITPHGLAMTKAFLVPLYKPPHGSESDVGVNYWPPVQLPQWKMRQPIPGAVIEPGKGLNLAFGIMRTTASTGRTVGPVITYTASGNTYTLQQPNGFIIPAKSCPH